MLALHALVADAPSAWLRGRWLGSRRAADRVGRLATGIESAVREAAGLDAALEEEPAELLRFVTRMAAAARTPRPAGQACACGRRRRLPAAQAPYPVDSAGQGRRGLARPLPGACGRPGSAAQGKRRRRQGSGRCSRIVTAVGLCRPALPSRRMPGQCSVRRSRPGVLSAKPGDRNWAGHYFYMFP